MCKKIFDDYELVRKVTNKIGRLYGEKIAILGGVDVDKLARYEHKKLRKYVRNIIEQCSPQGKFAIGSGNSVPNYIPLENYFIMVEETLNY